MVSGGWVNCSPTKDCLCYCPLFSHPKCVTKCVYFSTHRYVNLLLPCFPAYTLLSEPGRCSQGPIYLGGASEWASHCDTYICKNLNTTYGGICFICLLVLFCFVFSFCLLMFQAHILAEVKKASRIGRPSVGMGISCWDKSRQRGFNMMLIFSGLNQQLSLLLKLVWWLWESSWCSPPEGAF